MSSSLVRFIAMSNTYRNCRSHRRHWAYVRMFSLAPENGIRWIDNWEGVMVFY